MFPGGSRIFVTDRVGPPLLDQNRLDGFRYVQDWSIQKLLQDVCGLFQACTSAQTNQIPDLTPTRTPTLWGARVRQGPSHGSAAYFGGVFYKKNSWAAKRPASKDPHPEQSLVPTSPAHLGRVRLDP